MALAACGASEAPVTAAGPPIAIPHPPTPSPDGRALRFVGEWAAADGSCERAWVFHEDRFTTPGGVSCTFSQISPAPGGYDIAATCTAGAPAAPHQLEIRFADSAHAMLVGGGPMSAAALIACPADPAD